MRPTARRHGQRTVGESRMRWQAVAVPRTVLHCLPGTSADPLPAEGHADRAAPEVEVAEPEIEVVVRLVVLERTEVAEVTRGCRCCR
jgi:hypothetical protein